MLSFVDFFVPTFVGENVFLPEEMLRTSVICDTWNGGEKLKSCFIGIRFDLEVGWEAHHLRRRAR